MPSERKPIMNKKFKLGHFNARSLLSKLDQFFECVRVNELDVVGVTETWLDERMDDDSLYFPGYNFFRRDRGSRGGGVGMYVRDDLRATRVLEDFHLVAGVELIWVSVNIGKLPLLVGVVYRTALCNMTSFLTLFDDLLSFVVPQYDNIVVMGDINVDQLSDLTVSRCFSSYDFVQVIDEPTRVTTSSRTLLDVIFINRPDLVESSGTIEHTFSDHLGISCTIGSMVRLPSKTRFVTYRNYRNFNLENFIADLYATPWDDIFYILDIDDKLELLNRFLACLFNTHAPVVTSRVTKPFAPWLTSNIRILMKLRDAALSKYKSSRNVEDLISYRRLRNIETGAVRRQKAEYLSDVIRGKKSRLLWKALDALNIRGHTRTSIPSHLRNAEDIHNYFMSVFTPPNRCEHMTAHYRANKFDKKISFSFQLGTVQQISDIIGKLKSGSEGYDGITARMLQLCMPHIAPHVTHIINCCLEAGYFPAAWKFSLVKPIPKNSKPLSFSDLRPISIISTMSKVLEKLIAEQLSSYIFNNGIVSDFQSGFRKGHSTTTLLLDLVDTLIRSQDAGLDSAMVMLDYSKAFDTIDHALLCSKLEYYGFDDVAISFFHCYLCDRQQCVVIADARPSSFSFVPSGVPQGSVLGPLLYLIYVSDVGGLVKYSRIRSFADDTQLLISFKPEDADEALRQLNIDLAAIYNYSRLHNLTLNPDKCCTMLFNSRVTSEIPLANFQPLIDEKPLKVVEKARNLGVIFDCKLRFEEHVSLLVQKSYLVMRRLYRNRHLLGFLLRRKLCESLVLSILGYGLTLIYPCLYSITKNRLQKIQNACCRFVLGLRRFDGASAGIDELAWLRMDNLFKYYMGTTVFRVLLTASPSYLSNKLILRCNVRERLLRFGSLIDMPKYRLSNFRRSFTYNAVSIFNGITVTTCNSVDSFKRSYKNSLLMAQRAR